MSHVKQRFLPLDSQHLLPPPCVFLIPPPHSNIYVILPPGFQSASLWHGESRERGREIHPKSNWMIRGKRGSREAVHNCNTSHIVTHGVQTMALIITSYQQLGTAKD